jgi:hypothetical protein
VDTQQRSFGLRFPDENSPYTFNKLREVELDIRERLYDNEEISKGIIFTADTPAVYKILELYMSPKEKEQYKNLSKESNSNHEQKEELFKDLLKDIGGALIERMIGYNLDPSKNLNKSLRLWAARLHRFYNGFSYLDKKTAEKLKSMGLPYDILAPLFLYEVKKKVSQDLGTKDPETLKYDDRLLLEELQEHSKEIDQLAKIAQIKLDHLNAKKRLPVQIQDLKNKFGEKSKIYGEGTNPLRKEIVMEMASMLTPKEEDK